MYIRLNEQRFTNKNKIWYRGRDIQDSGFKNWGCLFLTTSLGYAYGYASISPNGFIEVHTLCNTPLNIFNAQNPTEYRLIEKHFPSYASQLKKGNWYEILGIDTRTDFLEILKELGYDGFINFEDEDDSAISIGLFNPQDSKVVETLTLDEVRETQEFRRYYMLERRFIYNFLKLHLVEGSSKIMFRKTIRILKEQDIQNIFKKLKISKTSFKPNAKLYLNENCCIKSIL